MNIPLTEETLAQIKEALFRGQRIEAIKLCRYCTGAGLADAKAVIDDLEAELRATSKKKFISRSFSRGRRGSSKGPRNGGCLVFFGVIFALIGGGIGVYSLSFSFGSARTEGIVIKLKLVKYLEESPCTWVHRVHPVVEYQVDGRTYTHVGGVGADPRTPTHKVGERVQVLYKS